MDDDDLSPGIKDKLKELEVSDHNNESTQKRKDEVKYEESKELSKEWRHAKYNPREQIIGDTSRGVCTRTPLQHTANFYFISQIVPKKMNDALEDEY